jgi:hypothetical protein
MKTLTPEILSDQIWVSGYFGQFLTYPYFIIFNSDFTFSVKNNNLKKKKFLIFWHSISGIILCQTCYLATVYTIHRRMHK